ncbi:MAG: preprotein translocase subunit SecB [Thiotrichales bacterium]
MNDALEKAKCCLQIQDVFLRACEAKLAEDFDPKYSAGVDELLVQFKHIVARSEVLTLEGDDGQPIGIFRVHIDVGARWIETASDADARETEKALIETTYVAEYLMTEDPGKAGLEAFALKNASYHVWPFWREYLMSQATRMNLPKVAVPTMLFASNSHAAGAARG